MVALLALLVQVQRTGEWYLSARLSTAPPRRSSGRGDLAGVEAEGVRHRYRCSLHRLRPYQGLRRPAHSPGSEYIRYPQRSQSSRAAVCGVHTVCFSDEDSWSRSGPRACAGRRTVIEDPNQQLISHEDVFTRVDVRFVRVRCSCVPAGRPGIWTFQGELPTRVSNIYRPLVVCW